MRRGMRFAVATMVLAAMMVPGALPAAAHGRLPTGVYRCHIVHPEGAAFGVIRTDFDVRIRTKHRYAFLEDGEKLGKAGRFRHVDGSKKIRFRKGYLKANGWRGFHRGKGRNSAIRLRQFEDGRMQNEYFCF